MRLFIFKIVLSLSALWLQSGFWAQVTAIGYCGSVETNYTNGAANDSIFYFYEFSPGNLSITPAIGQGPYDFVWQMLDTGLNQWMPFFNETDVWTSSIQNLDPACYRVSVFDANGVLLLCDRAWIAWFDPGNVQVFMEANCLEVHLWAEITGGSSSGYYNPPPDPMFVDSNTEITVCFDATHTWVSDLGFYLVGPASCGSPTVLLSPNPGAIGQGSICNGGDNVVDLCFTTESAGNLDVCAIAPSTLSGTYDSYGPGSALIDWSPIYGCDATSSGWAVQIYDCISLDFGALTSADISFNGINVCSQAQPINYSTPPGFSSPINDNSCSPGTASIFSVPLEAIEPINLTCGFEWNADPWMLIPDSANSLDITLPAPDVTTIFSLDFMCYDEDGNVVSPLDGDGNGCAGSGNNSVEFNPIPWVTPVLSAPSFLCEGQMGQLTSSHTGVWSGPSVDPNSGLFTGIEGNQVYLFTPDEICVNPTSINVFVDPYSYFYSSVDLGTICQSAEPISLGLWDMMYSAAFGDGLNIIGQEVLFDPGLVSPGYYEITVFTNSGMFGCSEHTDDFQIEVIEAPTPILDIPSQICISDAPIQLNANVAGGEWSGIGITDNVNGIFDPAIVGQGISSVQYSVAGLCPASTFGDISIETPPILELTNPGLICSNQTPFNLEANLSGGIWMGDGIVNSSDGEFDPQSINVNSTSISYVLNGVCPVEDSMQLNITSAPIPNAGLDVNICDGDSILLYTASAWDSADWNGNGQSEILAFDEATYTLTVGLNGCFASDEMNVNLIGYPNISIGQDITLCLGQTTTIYAPYIGEWSNGIESDSLVTGIPGWVTFTYANSGCPVVDSLYIELLTYPYVNLGPDIEICPGETVSLSIEDSGQWTTGAYSNTIDVSTEEVFAVEVWNGPCMSSDSIFVDVLPPPVADLGEDIEGCVGEPIYLSAQNTANDNYTWSDGSEDVDFIAVENNNTYWVETSNECGTAFDEIVVTFADCTPAYYIPNAFTPDGDGVNDFWHPITYRVTTYELIVFDRWGLVVFSSFNPDEVWTGNYNGSEHFVKDDVYLYILKYTTDEGDAGKVKGTVALVR